MQKTERKTWTRPELTTLGTMADVAGNGSSACQGKSTCSASFS